MLLIWSWCFIEVIFYRVNILIGRWRNGEFVQVPWVRTDIIIGIGGFTVMGGYLLKVLTPRSGDSTVAKKRYLIQIACYIFIFYNYIFSNFLSPCLNSLMHWWVHWIAKVKGKGHCINNWKYIIIEYGELVLFQLTFIGYI